MLTTIIKYKEREKRNQMKEKQHIQDSSQQQSFKMLKNKFFKKEKNHLIWQKYRSAKIQLCIS